MSRPVRDRVLVAGIGNVFFGDDGFGPAVAARLLTRSWPAPVDVEDFGIRGVHLAYELLEGRHRSLVLVDAVPLAGEPPGTLAVIEVDDPGRFGDRIDAHSMSPATVLAALSSLGGTVDRVLVVGCQPDRLDQGMVLSPAVEAALDGAVRLVSDVVAGELVGLAATGAREG